MENSITFEPIANTTDYIGMIIGIVVCLAIIIYSYLKKYKILPMVTSLILIILLGSIYMTWLAESKTKSITIYKDNFALSNQTIAFERIKNASFEEKTTSPISRDIKNNKERFLIIELVGESKPIVFPEQTFPIDSIKKHLDGRYRIWKKER